MGSISYKGQKINLSGVPFSDVVRMDSAAHTQHSFADPAELSRMTQADASTTPELAQSEDRTGDSRSRTAQTIQQASIFDDKFKELAGGRDGIVSYDRIANSETMQQANDALNEGGAAGVMKWMAKDPANATAQDIATGIILMDRYQRAGDYRSALEVMKKVRQMGTNSAQTVQMMSLLSRLTPEGMVYYAQESLSEAFEKMIERKSVKWAGKNRERFHLTDEDIDYISRRTVQAASLPEGRDKYVLLGEIAARIQDKLPPEHGQPIKALSRISMLFNPKTNVRNILGNIIVTPQHILSDFIGAGVDRLVSLKTGTRTTALPQMSALAGVKKGIYESFDDFRRGINTRDTAGDRFEIGQGRSFGSRSALGRSLNALDRVTSFLLDAGDRPFYETWFLNSLNGQMKAAGVTRPTADMIDIATQEALARTWQDNNGYTKFASAVRRGLNTVNVAGYGLGDMLNPFIKTPANLTKALVDFSPLGLAKALSVDAARFARAVGNGRATPQMQKQFVRSLSQGITGTLMTIGAAFLAGAGIATGAGDDDRDVANFERNILGKRPYSIRIGDMTFTYDWAQPVGGTLAAVTDVVNTVKSGDYSGFFKGGSKAEGYANMILSAIQSAGSVLYEQSFAQGLQTLFKQDDWVAGIIDNITGEPAKFTPQFLGQIAQLGDDKARSTYVYGNPLATARNKVMAKIPGLRNTLPEVVDVLGRDVEAANDWFNVFFNPANTSKASPTKASEEMYRLYQSTGDKGVIPPVAPYYVVFGGERVVLTPQQRNDYQRLTGRLADSEVERLMESAQYEKMTDDERAEIIKDLYGYAGALARETVVEDYEMSDFYKKVDMARKQGVSPANYFLVGAKKDVDGNGSVTQKEMAQALRDTSLTREQQAYLWALQNKTWKPGSNPFVRGYRIEGYTEG